MLWAITALTFLATFGVLAALFYAFSSQGGAVANASRGWRTPPRPG